MRVTKNEKLLAWPMVHATEMVAIGWLLFLDSCKFRLAWRTQVTEDIGNTLLWLQGHSIYSGGCWCGQGLALGAPFLLPPWGSQETPVSVPDLCNGLREPLQQVTFLHTRVLRK